MDVGVFKQQMPIVLNSNLQLFKQGCGCGESLYTIKETSSSQFFYPPKMLTNVRPPVLKKQIWDDNKLYAEGSLIKRYHNEVAHCYSLGNNQKVFASSYLQGQGYNHLSNVQSQPNCDFGLNSLTTTPPMSRESKPRVYGSSNLNIKRSGISNGARSIEPLIEKIDFHQKKENPIKKNKMHRSKTGKLRGRKSFSKKRKQNKNLSEDPMLSLQTNLQSKFCDTVYSADQNAYQMKTLLPKSADKLKPSEFSDFRVLSNTLNSVSENKINLLQHEKQSNRVLLPPTTVSNIKSTPPFSNDFELEKIPIIPCRVITPIINHRCTEDLTKNHTSSNSEELTLPPTRIGKVSPLHTIKPDANLSTAVTKKLLAKICKQGCIKKCSLPERKQSDNGLGERLSLIHSYGSDYQDIARKAEMQRRKEKALQQHQNKLAEKELMEKKKKEQRKKIYALNKLMTELEHEKFEEFMNTLDSSCAVTDE